MTRNPLDNCASLYNRFGDLDYAIERWLMDNRAVLKYKNRNNVKIIRYEDLTNHPESQFRDIFSCIDIPWSEDVLGYGATVYNTPLSKMNMAIRKEQVSKPIKNNSGKWKSVFDNSQAQLVIKKRLNWQISWVMIIL